MKKGQIIGIGWIILALYNLIFGIYFLYRFSTPNVFWLYMVPDWITFTRLFIGICGIVIGIEIYKRGKHFLIFPFSTLLLIYVIIDVINRGFEFLNDAGSNLIFLLLAVLTIKLNQGFEPERLKVFTKRPTIIFMVIGLTPYILNDWITYDWFNFLH